MRTIARWVTQKQFWDGGCIEPTYYSAFGTTPFIYSTSKLYEIPSIYLFFLKEPTKGIIFHQHYEAEKLIVLTGF